MTPISIGTKMVNINGDKFRMNYINVNHLVRLYDEVTRYEQPPNLHFPKIYKLIHAPIKPETPPHIGAALKSKIVDRNTQFNIFKDIVGS